MENIEMQDEINDLKIKEIAKEIELRPVLSSNIGGIGYDETNKLLKVAFKTKNGANIYVYKNVEKEVVKNLVTSRSVGKALNESIVRNKDKYKFIKL